MVSCSSCVGEIELMSSDLWMGYLARHFSKQPTICAELRDKIKIGIRRMSV